MNYKSRRPRTRRPRSRRSRTRRTRRSKKGSSQGSSQGREVVKAHYRLHTSTAATASASATQKERAGGKRKQSVDDSRLESRLYNIITSGSLKELYECIERYIRPPQDWGVVDGFNLTPKYVLLDSILRLAIEHNRGDIISFFEHNDDKSLRDVYVHVHNRSF